MIHQSSYQARRIVGQLQADEELVGALTRLCEEAKVKAGELRISGALKQIELARFDADLNEYRESHRGGPVEIVTLHGIVATIGEQVVLRLDALVSHDSGLGPHLISGQVRRAITETCEFVLDVFDDLRLTRGIHKTSGRTVLSEIITTKAPPTQPAPSAATQQPQQQIQPQPQAASSQNLSWDAVSAVSQELTKPVHKRQETSAVIAAASTPKPAPQPVKAASSPHHATAPNRHSILVRDDEDDDEDDDLPDMRPGDTLDHPTLGRCRIMRIEDDDSIHIRMKSGKINKLVLSIFDISLSGIEDGRNVFRLRLRQK